MANKARPKTGEARKTNQPLKIDRLPPSVHDAILKLRNRDGKTWQEIEELSALPMKDGGFVEWEKLPTPVLELFPDMRLPHTNLHRWFDLRVKQVQAQVLQASAQARVIAKAFAKSTVAGDREAVINAARDQIMSVLSESGDRGSKMGAAKALIMLADIMNEARLNEIKERKVTVDERNIQIVEKREELQRKKLEREAAELERKRTTGELKAEDLAQLVERTFGIAPKPTKAA